MTKQNADEQRRQLDQAGSTLIALSEEGRQVHQQDVEDACVTLAEIEKEPATEELGKEAAHKLEELNRARALPSSNDKPT